MKPSQGTLLAAETLGTAVVTDRPFAGFGYTNGWHVDIHEHIDIDTDVDISDDGTGGGTGTPPGKGKKKGKGALPKNKKGTGKTKKRTGGKVTAHAIPEPASAVLVLVDGLGTLMARRVRNIR